MKAVLISLAVVAVIGGVLVLFVLVKFGGAVSKAHGQALYSSVGAWTRIQEFAHAQGKSNYIAEAESKLTLIKSDLKAWRETAPSSTDFAALEKMQATAYDTTDKNIKNGQNPLAYLDGAASGTPGSGATFSSASSLKETALGIEIATLPHAASSEEFRTFLGVFESSGIPHRMVADVEAYRVFVPRQHVEAARKALLEQQQRGLKLTIK
jgi:Tfp pilus assembly protein PilE